MLPASRIPLWEREGVTLLAAAENKRITGKRGFHKVEKKKNIFKKIRSQRIFDPGSTGRRGTSSDAEFPAARIMPLLSTPKIFTGARFVTTTTSLPTSSSGL